MSSINKYESLKKDGAWIDRLKYVLSLSDKSEIEKHLKQTLSSSYDDLQIFIFLSKSTKNEKNLLEIFKNDSLPVRQRAHAGKYWLNLQKDEKQIRDFIVESINNKNLPRYLKHQLLKCIHHIKILQKSASFLYDLTCNLTELNNHDQYNINAHLVTFCKKDQIINLLSRWSIKRLEQLDHSSVFYSKLIKHQPIIIIDLIKNDLNEIKTNKDKYSFYFQENEKLFNLLVKKVPKELICLIIEYLNDLEKNKRLLPDIIQSNQEYFFKKTPDEMIKLITIVASNQPGEIKYKTRWYNEGYDLDSFSFPKSFSIENYVRLFFSLYDTCKWSSNHTIRLFEYMIKNTDQNESLYSIKKQKKWLFDIVINERIGKEEFLKKLIKEGNENTLEIFEKYPELTTPLSIHLLLQHEKKGIVKAPQRLSLIRYQTMTQNIFDEFLSLFKQTGSDVNQRQENYPLFLKCAISTNEQYVKKVLEWIEKRFTNEQIIVIDHFLSLLSSYNNLFHLKYLPNVIQSIQTIIDIAINHLQHSTNTLRTIMNYGVLLLQRVERHQNKEEKEKIQTFATKIIKQCLSNNESLASNITLIYESHPQARNLVVNILISDVFPKLVSKCMLDQLNNSFDGCIEKPWRLPQLDSFLNKFFTESLPSSTKLQSNFRIDRSSSIISIYLKNKSTRFDRVNQLINKIDKIFFIDENVQRIALLSQQHRQLIDELIKDDKCVTLDKLSNEQSKFEAALESSTKNMKLPGLDINLLNSYSHLLTGNEQEHITKIILDDYLQDAEISNLNKLKSLRVLRRLTHTYNETLQWLDKKQDSSFVAKNSDEGNRGRTRGATAQSLDDIIICLPATFDLIPQILLKHFHLLKTKLNASNAKYISDAFLNISRKINDETFFKHYLEFVQDEQFQKLGITANKEILRLLIQYSSDSNIIKIILKPLWDSHPHQDIRACLILILLHFLQKLNLNNNEDNEIVIWKILEEATNDDYLPVIQSLFAAQRGKSRWPLSQLKYSSNEKIFEKFVNEIQFKILDHPTSLEAREYAWSNIDDEYCHIDKIIEKVQQICIQFDIYGNTLWRSAFQKIISFYRQKKISSIDIIINIIKQIMSNREEIDSKQNGIDNQHDLPVYHRLQHLLTDLISQIDQFDNERKRSFRSLSSIILQFDKTLSPLLGKLLIKISQNKEDLEDSLKILQENLPEIYFEQILIQLSTVIQERDSCPFIKQLNSDEKLDLAQWFIKEKNRPLFVFDLLKNHVFNQNHVDRNQCQEIVQLMRKSDNLYLRQQAMEYTVNWGEEDDNNNNDDDDNDKMSGSNEFDDSNMG